MKQSIEYLNKALEYLEKCELASPYKNVVDVNNAKIALQMVELEHKIEDAKQLHHYEDVEEFKKEHEVKSFALSASEVNNSFKSNNYCVIAGAYKKLENAKLGQRILKRELNLQTYIIKKPNSKFYFVATDFFDNTKEIKKEHKRLKKMGIDKLINGATWVYKVE